MARAGIYASANGPDMGARADAVTVKSATRTDGCHMRAGVHAVVAHTGAGAYHRSDMATRGDAMLANARTRAGAEHMAARTDTVLVNVHVSAHAQHIDAKINSTGVSRCEQRHQQGHSANGNGELFHGENTSWGLHANAR